jgi:HSP20 family protein
MRHIVTISQGYMSFCRFFLRNPYRFPPGTEVENPEINKFKNQYKEDSPMTLIRFHNHPAMNNAYGQFFSNPTRNCNSCNPPANIYEQDNTFFIELAAPGYAKDDFNISLEQQVLSISAAEKHRETENEKYLRREFGTGEINKRFVLPKTVDNDNIKADYQNGILKIHIPVKKEVKLSREIAIS